MIEHEFYRDGNRLVYDPDTSVEGDDIILVRGGLDLVAFEVSDESPPKTITFTLALAGGEHNTEITNTIKPRN